MSTTGTLEERRLFPRTRALRGGRIIFNRASSIIDCTMTNHSDGGARLNVASPLGIPAVFEFRLAQQPAGRQCEVVWRKADAVGIQYTSL